MQKLATKVFIYSSMLFGVLGVVMVFTGIDPDDNDTGLVFLVTRLFMASVFVILTSFALSVAGKYLQK